MADALLLLGDALLVVGDALLTELGEALLGSEGDMKVVSWAAAGVLGCISVSQLIRSEKPATSTNTTTAIFDKVVLIMVRSVADRVCRVVYAQMMHLGDESAQYLAAPLKARSLRRGSWLCPRHHRALDVGRYPYPMTARPLCTL